MASKPLVHVFLVSFPGQGHVNPLLRLSNLLASGGFFVTFSTTVSFGKQMQSVNPAVTGEPTPVGDGFIRFEFFDEELALDDPRRRDPNLFFYHLELAGKENLRRLVENQSSEDGRPPVSCLINNPFLPWVADVADSLGIPCAILWVESCASLSAYYHYYHGLVPFPDGEQPELDVEIPFLPLLKHHEIPSYLHPNDPCTFLKKLVLGQIKRLPKIFCVLIDTFEELEPQIIRHVSDLIPISSVGPLLRYRKSSSWITGDRLKTDDCIEWLDSKPPSSVLVMSFGSVAQVKQEQIDEIAHGLLSSCVSFLWVMTPPMAGSPDKPRILPDGFSEKMGDRGKVVEWSPQERVLAHPSVACLVTHCGWNTTVEVLSNGKPVLAFPQWGDQVNNAKFLVDVFGVGIRVYRGEDRGSIVSRDEFEKCVREAMSGPKAVDIKENAMRWKKVAEEAVAEGGSSRRNMLDFMEEIKRSVD